MHALYAFDSVCWYRLCAAHARVFVLHCLRLNIVFHNYLMLLLYCGLCQYMSVLLVYFVCCQWYTKCVPRELISRSSASQTADGILRCGLSVSILRFPLCGVRPRGLIISGSRGWFSSGTPFFGAPLACWAVVLRGWPDGAVWGSRTWRREPSGDSLPPTPEVSRHRGMKIDRQRWTVWSTHSPTNSYGG